MGLIRKAMSVSSLGGVKYTSKREAQTKLALEQAKALRRERKAEDSNADKPLLLQPTVGALISEARRRRAASKEDE
jgi:hypothetical protein